MPEFNAYPLQLSMQSHYIQAGTTLSAGVFCKVSKTLPECYK